MKQLKFILVGIAFGIILTKAEAISFYRMQEMFRFQSFYMFGILGTAVTLGAISVALIKKFKLKDISGNPIIFIPKDKSIARYLSGGIIFGLGWALAGACPGPMFANLGAGYFSFIIVILSALAGTYLYGVLKDRLPH